MESWRATQEMNTMAKYGDWLYIIAVMGALVGFFIWNKYRNRKLRDRKQRNFRGDLNKK